MMKYSRSNQVSSFSNRLEVKEVVRQPGARTSQTLKFFSHWILLYQSVQLTIPAGDILYLLSIFCQDWVHRSKPGISCIFGVYERFIHFC